MNNKKSSKKKFDQVKHLKDMRDRKKANVIAKEISGKPRFISDALRELAIAQIEHGRILAKAIEAGFKRLEDTLLEIYTQNATVEIPETEKDPITEPVEDETAEHMV